MIIRYLRKIIFNKLIDSLKRDIDLKDEISVALMHIIKHLLTRNNGEIEYLLESDFNFIPNHRIRILLRPFIMATCVGIKKEAVKGDI